MPRIPSIERQVGPDALPGVRQQSSVDGNTFGAGVWREVGDLARTAQREVGRGFDLAMDARDQEDTRRAREAATGAEQELNSAVLELQQKNGGDMARPFKGKSVTQLFDEKATEIHAKASKGLSPAALERFDMVYQGHRGSQRLRMADFEHKESIKTDLANGESMIDLARSTAAANYQDPNALRELREVTGSEVAYRARMLKRSPEEQKAETLAEMSKGHAAVIESALANNDVGFAQAYFSTHKGEIDGRLHGGFTRQFTERADLESAQAFAGEALIRHGEEGLAPALAEAREKLSGQAQELAVREIRERFADAAVEKDRIRRQEYGRFTGELLKMSAAGRSPDEIRSFAAETAVGLDPEYGVRFRSLGENLAAAQRRQDSDPAADALAAYEVKARFDKGELKDLGSMVEALGPSATSAQVSDVKRYFQTQGNSDSVKASRIEAVWNDLAPGQKMDVKAAPGIYRMMQDLRRDYPGQEVPEPELRKRIAGMLLSGESKGGWFTAGYGADKTGIKALAAGELPDWLPDIKDDTERTLLTTELLSAGVSEEDAKDEVKLRLWKKEKAGLPLSQEQMKLMPWRRPVLRAAPGAKPAPALNPARAKVSSELDSILGKE